MPYSLSLALRVCYRELRLSKTPFYHSKARSEVLLICTLLERFASNFTFADTLSRLAVNLIEEMDKVATSVLQARHRVSDQPTSSTCPEDEQQTTPANAAPDTPGDISTKPNKYPSIFHSTANGNESCVPRIPEYDHAQYDAETFEDIYKLADLPNIFEHFDPEFNLAMVDLALGQNLELDSIVCTETNAQWLDKTQIVWIVAYSVYV